MLSSGFIRRHSRTVAALAFLFAYSVGISFATPPASKYTPGSTLQPSCLPGSTNCTTQILPDQASNANRLLSTDGTNTTWVNTLTGVSLSGSTNTLTNIPNTALTNSTITINGSAIALGGSVSNLALTTNPLSQFASTTSAQLAGVLSDETGTGTLVYATSPTLTTPNIGAATGTSLALSGGASFLGNVGVGTASPGAKLDVGTASSIIANFNSSNQYGGYLQIQTGGTTYGYIGTAATLNGVGSTTDLGIRFENQLVFLGGTTTRLTIDSSGNIGVPDLAGVGNRCVYADATGQLNVKGFDCGSASGGDNLGDHTATQNIIMGTNWISGDGGAEGIRIDNSGNVGIGTASPLATLNVNGSTIFGTGAWPTLSAGQSAGRVLISGTNEAVLLLNNSNNTIAADTASFIQLGARATTSTNDAAAITLIGARETAISGTFSSYFAVKTMNGTDGTQFERLRITAAGNVGIGTNSPAEKLAISGGNFLMDSGQQIQWGSINESIRGSVGAHKLFFRANGVDSMTLDGSGNLGLGTVTPSKMFHVLKNGQVEARFEDTSASAYFTITQGTNSYLTAKNSLWLSANDTLGTGVVILPSGNVGIGMADPGYRLDVKSSGVGPSISVRQSNSTNPVAYVGESAAGTGYLGLVTANVGESIRLDANGDSFISRGNVGIGTTSPGSLLNAYSTNNAAPIVGLFGAANTVTLPYSGYNSQQNSAIQIAGSAVNGQGGPGLLLNNTTASGNLATDTSLGVVAFMGGSTAATEKRGAIINGIVEGNSATTMTAGMAFYTNNAGSIGERMRIASSGKVGIGIPSPQAKLEIAAGGSTVGLTEHAAIRITPSQTMSTDQIVFGYSEAGGYSPAAFGYIGQTATGYQYGDLFFATRSVTTNTAPTERMRITSTGNVGIGTSSPASKFSVAYDKSTTLVGSSIYDTQAYSVSGAGGFMGLGGKYNSGGSSTEFAAIGGIKENTTDGNYAGNLILSSRIHGGAMTEAMRINASQQVLVGTTSPLASPAKLVATTFGSPNTNIYFSNATSQGQDGIAINNATGGGAQFLYGATAWSAFSDERLKQNLVPIEDGLTKLLTLRTLIGTFINDPTQIKHPFLIAQDVQAVLPEAVSVGNDEAQTLLLRYTDTIPLIIAAIKDMNIQVQGIPKFEDQTLYAKVADFLRGIAERGEAVINLVTAHKVQTQELCVGDANDQVCVTKSQLQQILLNNGISGGSSSGSGQNPPLSDPVSATCTDGIQNQDETGVDTGGVCGGVDSPQDTPPPTDVPPPDEGQATP